MILSQPRPSVTPLTSLPDSPGDHRPPARAARPGQALSHPAARRLVASNAFGAGGRSATDAALDVLAVLVLGVGADGMGVLMTLSGLGFLLLGVPIGIVVDRHLSPRLLAATGLAKAAVLGSLAVVVIAVRQMDPPSRDGRRGGTLLRSQA